jgi:hypothetical protein
MLRSLCLVCLGAIIAIAALHRSERPREPLLIQADYPVCVTIHNGPIVKNKPKLTYQRERGIA